MNFMIIDYHNLRAWLLTGARLHIDDAGGVRIAGQLSNTTDDLKQINLLL